MQDNSPSVVSESLMCGTPVIGSSSGGLPEMLSQFNQAIFSVSNSSELAEKIMNFVPHKIDAVTLASVRNKYSYTASASQHKKLYELPI
jgi:glycosyltransferase involved in cell wall biosynthesis